jgi:Xaa-Pro aminopeptidase
MFVQPYDAFTEKWDGRRIGLEGARNLYGASQAYPISELESFLKDLLNQKTTIITDLPLGVSVENNMLLGTHINTKSSSATHVTKEIFSRNSLFHKSTVKPIGTLIEQFRLIKSEQEKNVLRNSGQIAGRAFVKVNTF